MADISGKWLKLEQRGSGPGARSSHAITVLGNKAYAFGGELIPFEPVDNKIHVFDLEALTWSVPDVFGDVPPPRAGVTMAAIGATIYVFGGRENEEVDLNDLYAFDTETSEWALLSTGDAGPYHRSYHSMAADDRRVYVFGGCGAFGTLKDFWAYDVVERKWDELPKPGLSCWPRAGAGLAVAGSKIWVLYGLSGRQLCDVHCFDPSTMEWVEVETKGEKPCPRSVFSIAGFGEKVVVYGGEADPVDEGYLAPGRFVADVFELDVVGGVWRKVKDEAEGEHPGPRGYCAFSVGCWEGEEGLLVYGGNSPTVRRLDDIFFFTPHP
ncbi:thiohydroximate-O-sulfate sulfur/sulfate-lyase (nitrile-forming) NSP5-like [Wolffia australiana]